jgi:hypothetical protein
MTWQKPGYFGTGNLLPPHLTVGLHLLIKFYDKQLFRKYVLVKILVIEKEITRRTLFIGQG